MVRSSVAAVRADDDSGQLWFDLGSRRTTVHSSSGTGGSGQALPPLVWAGYNTTTVKRMERRFDVIIERDEDGFYVASVPSFPGCQTQAQSLDDLMARIREAVSLCLEVEGKAPKALEFVGVQRITVAA